MADLVLASSNVGKLRELQHLLGSAWRVRLQTEFGIQSVEETGTTFVANALLKARHAARIAGLPALADDSGLEVDALGGAPGVHSARYAGPGADDEANNRKLLAALTGVPARRRTARYRCALIWIEPDDHWSTLTAEGTWEGAILETPRGTGGFGYDPLFLDPVSGLSAAELEPEAKNHCSHRGQALRRLYAQLAQRLPGHP